MRYAWYFFEGSGPPGLFFRKKNIRYFDMIFGSVCTKFQVSSSFNLVRRREKDTNEQTD